MMSPRRRRRLNFRTILFSTSLECSKLYYHLTHHLAKKGVWLIQLFSFRSTVFSNQQKTFLLPPQPRNVIK